VKRARLPRCIAFVPERWVHGRANGERVQAHRCPYQAHAAELVGVLLCRVHAGMRVPRRKRDRNQVELFAAAHAC